MFSSIVVVSFLASSVVAYPQSVFVGKNGEVGASFGGYSASAGLGGLVNKNGGVGGGLHAEAGTPYHYAGAGLGGNVNENGQAGGLYSSAGHTKPIHTNTIQHGSASSSASASASAGSSNVPSGGSHFSSSSSSASAGAGAGAGGGVYKPGHGNFFDSIFNIPISVLNSVNSYLNTKPRVSGKVHYNHVSTGTNTNAGLVGTGAGSSASSSSQASSSVQASVGGGAASAGSSAQSSTSAVSGNVAVNKGRPNYDQIFDIPRSALFAVNQFLNGKK